MATPSLYGLMAEFDNAEAIIKATHRAHEEGFMDMDAYTPFPVEEVMECVSPHNTGVPLFVLIGGVTGALSGFILQMIAMTIDYPLNVGGRPPNITGWPSFIPITFESGILLAAFSAVISMIALNGLPMPYHPVFNVPGFERASQDRFFLCIEASDPKFDPNRTRQFLQSLGPQRVVEVEP
jgi:hypothetical protein